VLDVGASLSNTAPPYQPLIDAGLARIIGFEPDRNECAKLNAHFGPPHEFFPYFVGDGNPATFHETNWFGTGSLYKPNTKLLERFQDLSHAVTLVAEHPVKTKALDDMVEIDDVDYFKIDVQGAELAVFAHAKRLLEKATVIHSEVEFLELYENQPLFSDVDAFLRSCAFSFVRFTHFGTRLVKPLAFNRPLHSQILWADVIYVKDLADAPPLAEDKLIKMAIIAHDMYGLCDHAAHLLQRIDKMRGSAIVQEYVNLLNSGQPPAGFSLSVD
jgi:FkbM family methyltransferase